MKKIAVVILVIILCIIFMFPTIQSDEIKKNDFKKIFPIDTDKTEFSKPVQSLISNEKNNLISSSMNLLDSRDNVFKKVVLKGECQSINHLNGKAEKFGHIGSFWFFPAKSALEVLMLKDFELTIDGESADIESPVILYFYRFTGFSPTPMNHDISKNKNITIVGYCEEVRPLSQQIKNEIYDEPLFEVFDIDHLEQTAYGATSGDFNSDGQMDFAVSWATDNWPVSLPDISISIFYNNGDISFSRVDVYTHKWEYWGYIYDLESGDFDGDGDIDFLFTLNENINQYKTNGTIYILFNNGDNTFGEKILVAKHCSDVDELDGRFNPRLTSGDYDNDGDIDFLVGDNSGIVEFYKNNGDGTFMSVGVIHDFGCLSLGLTSGDFDGDGDIDFYIGAEIQKYYGDIYFMINQFVESDGSVIFTNESIEHCIQFYAQHGTSSLQSIDYNGDGIMDLIAGIDWKVMLFIKENDSWQQFLAGGLPNFEEDGQILVDGLLRGGLSAGDFNGDGREDLITGGMSGTPRLCLNNFSVLLPPLMPVIDGPDLHLIPGEWYDYTIDSINDVNGGNLSVFVDWGDGTDTGWIGPYVSNDVVKIGHSWDEYGQYVLRVKVRDSDGLESNWGDLIGPVYLSRSAPIWDWFLAKFFPIQIRV